MTSLAPSELWLLTTFVLAVQFVVVAMAPAPLSDPDETLFCAVAREMMQSGDYVVPRYQGQPFLDRPAFYYWWLVASVGVFGDSIFAYRLPSHLLGLGTILATAAIARRCFGPLVGATTALCFATMVAQVVISLAVGHDSALVFFSTAAIWAAVGARSERSSTRSDLLAGALMGLAVLSKGLLGIIIPSIAIFWLDGAARRRPLPSWMRMLSLATVVGGSWYLAVHRSQPGFLWYFFVERHLAGFLTNTQRHGGQSVLIYVPTLLLGGLPAIALLFRPTIELARLVRSEGFAACWKEWRGAPTFAVTGWLTTIVLFFALAGSKNPSYLLPAFIPLSILAGVALSRWIRDHELNGRVLLSAAAILSAALVSITVVGVLPAIASERSAENAVGRLRSLRSDEPILWFNHVPPSARFHAPDLPIERVYYASLVELPRQRTLLVTRISRLEEVLSTPFARYCKIIDPGGKYKVLVCTPSP